METYWNRALGNFPLNSKWKNKATGEIYKISEIIDCELGYVAIKLESQESDSVCIAYNIGLHLDFTRVA